MPEKGALRMDRDCMDGNKTEQKTADVHVSRQGSGGGRTNDKAREEEEEEERRGEEGRRGGEEERRRGKGK